jgi:G3E family GTPase
MPSAEAAPVPVTVLCGFLGAGKTTMMKHILLHEAGRGQRIAAIVNDVAALNVDGNLLSHACSGAVRNVGGEGDGASAPGGGSAQSVVVLTLEGGSICSALQEDLATQLIRTIEASGSGGPFQHVFVECSGVTHPAAIAALFEDHQKLSRVACLHATVTVVDCYNLRRVLLPSGGGSVTVEDAWKSVRKVWDDAVTNLFVEQIECASLLVLNKADTISPTDYESCRACIEAFNRRTQPLRATFGQIDSEALVNATPGDGFLAAPSQVLSSRRWLQALPEGDGSR